MDRKPSAVHIVGFFTQQVEQLRVAEGNQEVKAVICVRHDQEQCRLAVSQRVQFQLVVGSQLPNLLDVEHRQPRATGNQDTLGGFARNELSRTF